MALIKRQIAVKDTAICFGCNQSFQGNPIALQFESDLVPANDRGELSGLPFHPGHLIHYARRREWHALTEFLVANGPQKY